MNRLEVVRLVLVLHVLGSRSRERSCHHEPLQHVLHLPGLGVQRHEAASFLQSDHLHLVAQRC